MTRDELWDRLAEAGLVHGGVPDEAAPTPWYVAAMVGLAAWIASIFLLVFLGAALAGILRQGSGAIATGAILCGLCIVAMRVRGNAFVDQMALAASLAGQALIGYGILDGQWRSPAAWLAFAAVEAALCAAAPLFVHRVLAALAAACALRFALAHAGAGVLFAPLVAGTYVLAWTSRAVSDGLRLPLTAGLALAALLIVPVSLVDAFAWGARAKPLGGAALPWIAAFALAGVLLACIARLLRESGTGLGSRVAMLSLAAGAAVALAARPLPGLVVALVVLLTAFNDGRRALMGLAIAGMIGALVHYYHALDATLMTKAAALFATGIVLVVAGIALRLGLAEPERSHA